MIGVTGCRAGFPRMVITNGWAKSVVDALMIA
jgi:hypothetical protein